MTERYNDPAASGRPFTTGEFRATPDISASTAQFQAFAEGSAAPERTWEAAPGRSPARMAALVVAVIVVVAIIVVLIATLA